MLRQTTLHALLLSGSAWQADAGYYPPEWIPFGQTNVEPHQGLDNFESSDDFWRQGFRYPNLTSSIQLASAGNLTWRVNITEFSVPPATSDGDNSKPIYPDPRLVTSNFELFWPDDQAPDVTNHSTGDDDSEYACALVFNTMADPLVLETQALVNDGSCDSALGYQCVRDFLAAIQPSGSRCGTVGQVPGTCNGTLATVGGLQNGTGLYASNIHLYPSNASSYGTYYNQSQLGQTNIHDAFNIFMSTAYPTNASTNSTTYIQYANTLQILALTGLRGEQDRAMMCQRLNNTPIDELEEISKTSGAGKGQGIAKMGALVLSAVVAVVAMFGL